MRKLSTLTLIGLGSALAPARAAQQGRGTGSGNDHQAGTFALGFGVNGAASPVALVTDVLEQLRQ